MPTNIRAILSLIVALVTAVLFYLEIQGESSSREWLALGLGALMILAVWLFPEAKSTSKQRK